MRAVDLARSKSFKCICIGKGTTAAGGGTWWPAIKYVLVIKIITPRHLTHLSGKLVMEYANEVCFLI